MPLERLSLDSLSRTRLGPMFDEAMAAIIESMEKDSDVAGARGISISLSFTPDKGIIMVGMSCKASTPHRSVKTIAALDGGLKIDTITDDARQPSMFDDTNVTPIKKEAVANG